MNKVKIPAQIDITDGLRDHRFEEKPVLPAVFSMEILAKAVKEHIDDFPFPSVLNACFNKFLFLDKNLFLDKKKMPEIFCEIEIKNKKLVFAKLLTKTKSLKTGITRTKEHVSLAFGKALPENISLRDFPRGGEGFKISSQKLYEELVPFGPCFRNIKDDLELWEHGVKAIIRVPESGENPESGKKYILGSPFALDAAFHGACAWGQRYARVVAFPVGLNLRHIINPVYPGETCKAIILPKCKKPDLLIFDIFIMGCGNNEFKEIITGLKMRDVSSGRMVPPKWVKDISFDNIVDKKP